ncbi:MAG: hypothetical protein HUU11_18120 [Anaerolineales bacterium]|nr:hypothetical protein [Anaerolineales bacterium]
MAVEFDRRHQPIVSCNSFGALRGFVIKFKYMGDIRFYHRPWFYLIFPPILVVILYFFTAPQNADYRAYAWGIARNLAIYFTLLILWLAFFAQFVLPVHTFRDRQKIFNRLIAYLFGRHGPAIFIRNGQQVKGEGEEKKNGPGVLWLDSASAAVTRTATEIKQTIGPGVHFIDKGEFIAGTVDLHIQTHSINFKDNEDPFAEKAEDQPPEKIKDQNSEKLRQLQDRRKMVSALTRDGIEVIPNISITFRVNTGFPEEGEPGSRFGYRTGETREGKENEKKDKEAIFQAIIGQGVKIDLNALNESARKRLAWNELPLSLAIDVWREYAAKFTLDQFFNPTRIVQPPEEGDSQSAREETKPASGPEDYHKEGIAAILGEINSLLGKAIEWFEVKKDRNRPQKTEMPEETAPDAGKKKGPQTKTALQVINDMIKARLTQSEVDYLDDHGKRDSQEKKIESDEYKLLKSRGLIVQNVSISNLKLHPTVDEQLIKQWSANWLSNAKAESDQIDRKWSIVETIAREQALIKYAEALSREINALAEDKQPNVRDILKRLFIRTRALIRSGKHSDQLRRRMSLELQEIEDMIKWVEENGK